MPTRCFRVGRIKGIYQGGNFTAEMKNEIARYFNADQIKYVFVDR
jgi:hypothetical protein